ncbi:DUF1780 domain-containing protein, partial [Pseudomonas aeruginosa]|nr:DUF1780 domain-containing protein [Pseudomonas aeruginosa]
AHSGAPEFLRANLGRSSLVAAGVGR